MRHRNGDPMNKIILASLLALTTGHAMSAQTASTAKAITVHDLVRLERVSDPRLSPDGRQVAYTLRTTDYEANKGVRNLWVADTAGKDAPRALTTSGGYDGRWSPDGKWLYFMSTRSGSAQVWRLYGAGGEPQQVTRLPLDVLTYVISPNGKQLALSLEVFADCKELACTKQRLDAVSAQKNTGMLFDKIFVRHWDTWKNGTRAQLFVADLADSGIQGEPRLVSQGIDGDVPSKPFGDDSEITFSPDGQWLVFAARIAGTTEPWSTNLDLWRVPVDGSTKPVNLTTGNAATDTSPVFSPDGSLLYYKAMKRPGFEADRYAIMERNLATGATREIAPNWDRSPDNLTLSADGKTLYAFADDLGQRPLFAIDVRTGGITRITGSGSVGSVSVGKDRLVYTLNTLTSPDHLYQSAPDGGERQQLTQHNAATLAGLRFGEFEQFKFAGAGGDTVYGHVMKPWNYVKGKKYPVAFIVHGGPQGSMGNSWHYRWNPAVFSGMGYAVVFIDFHGSTGYGQAFTDSISGDWGGKPLEDLQKGWKHALAQYDYLDGSKAAALGASYGGYMMNWIEGNWPDAFKCIVNHDGVFDNRSMAYSTEELWFDEWEHKGTQFDQPQNYEKHNPVNHLLKWKTPMLVIHGEKDYRIPPEQGIAAFTALQRRGIPSQLLIFPDENHWVLKPQNSVQWHDTVQAWLKRWIGG